MGFIACVHHHVNLQTARSNEGLVAYLTLERALPGVDLHVLLEVTGVFEIQLALDALANDDSGVHVHVLLEARLIVVRFGAIVAGEDLNLFCCVLPMHQHVTLQDVQPNE